MAFVQLDDNFVEHRKIAALSLRAFKLHVAALCHCNRHLTDGHISAHALKVLLVSSTARRPDVAELVAAGLWHENNGDYTIHDFLDWNPSREIVGLRKAKAAARKAAWRAKNDEAAA